MPSLNDRNFHVINALAPLAPPLFSGLGCCILRSAQFFINAIHPCSPHVRGC